MTQILVRKKRQLHFVTLSASDVSHGLFNGLEAGSYLVKKNTIDIFERLMWSLFPCINSAGTKISSQEIQVNRGRPHLWAPSSRRLRSTRQMRSKTKGISHRNAL